jgi:plasmid maintenance system killer protein
MDIIFKSKALLQECSRHELLVKRHGRQRAKLIRRRLDDLRAAANLLVMRALPGHCHELKGNRAGQLSIDLDGPYRLIFRVTNDPIPTRSDGGLDWARATAIEILGMEDTHE